MAEASTLEDMKTVMATLCEGAPNSTVRNCLRKYDPSKTSVQIEKALKTEKKPVLVETLEYLGVTGTEEYRHSALPHELLCRVQNFFPDTCGMCNEVYCIKLEDRPIISCVRCGQGCHNACVLKLMNKSYDELNESNQFGLDILNPFAALGLFYVCPPCQEKVVPNKDDLKTRKRGPATNGTVTDQPNLAQDTTAPDGSQGINPSVADPGTRTRRISTVSNASDSTDANTIGDDNRREPGNNEQRPICKFYRQGRCKHGISGNKDGPCNFRHPKPCNKFLANGTNQRRGCTKGNQCTGFHPQMCHRSLKERICSRRDCKFMHIKGTKRHEEQANETPPSPERLMSIPPSQLIQRDVLSHNVPQSTTSKSGPQSDDRVFGMMKTMEEQLSRITTKLNQLDQSYQQLSHQQTPTYPPTSGKSQSPPISSTPNFLYQIPPQVPYFPYPQPLMGQHPPQQPNRQ